MSECDASNCFTRACRVTVSCSFIVCQNVIVVALLACVAATLLAVRTAPATLTAASAVRSARHLKAFISEAPLV